MTHWDNPYISTGDPVFAQTQTRVAVYGVWKCRPGLFERGRWVQEGNDIYHQTDRHVAMAYRHNVAQSCTMGHEYHVCEIGVEGLPIEEGDE